MNNPTDALGPLERRLLDATLDALADTPADAVSLRQIAHSVGVSHQAPYVHFGSRRRFLAAVAGAGLHQAAQEATAAVAAAAGDPLGQLQALAGSYLHFIRTRPHLHDLAYGPALAKQDHPLLQDAAITYWALLHDAVAACQPPNISDEEVLRRSAAAWGTVYGIARLAVFHQIPEAVAAGTELLVHTTLDALVTGWRTQP